MASQKSTATDLAANSDSGTGRAPKRARGRQRVAALLDAATLVFAEKGYDAATMTEIASRSNTAIGSLYRFFPSKEALAEALLRRYGERAGAGLDAIAAQARDLTAGELADALLDLMMALKSERTALKVLMDARVDGDNRRQYLRGVIRGRLAGVLSAHAPSLSADRAAIVSVMLLHLMKAIPELAQEGEAAALIAEMRLVLGAYLAVAVTAG
ncbi:TetR/AcrR family transcriptional regulator [Nitrospirillum sp. BR 11163]|uniref:TetR/AcrR family transcriptional regulator n=1 Tax=Nitrospirillum sp. BR 11163 TaxID=3104323 RepID=UPI002AFFD6B0|nr:TetR/AcrR family transcriptional regulator [Nitrospirillum sp. BR 11163]MEA1676764.1 TetR/AcrR family transcriptional regulator [Nitrospirillum sp. BR 11163]